MMSASAYQAHRALGELTTYRIGGPAKQLFIPKNIEDLSEIVRCLNETGEEFFILGGGSNVLISDRVIDKPVILMTGCCKEVKNDGLKISCGASVKLWDLVNFAIDIGISGLEELTGIPGTLGGALRMNAGAFGNEISSHLISVSILNEDGNIENLKFEDIGFAYRSAPGLESKLIIGAEFRFLKYDREGAKKIADEIWALRQSKHPLEYPSAGSVFKKHEQGPAGKFIEDAGLKGLRIGNAEISLKHANFIVNKGGARAIEILALMRKTQRTVEKKFGISLELEQKLIGFTEDELKNPEKYL